MAQLGFQMLIFGISANSKQQTLPLDHPCLGNGSETALAAFERYLTTIKEEGRWERPDLQKLLCVTALRRSKQALTVHLEGGRFGDDYSIRHRQSSEVEGRVTSDHALEWDANILFIFPPGATWGVIFSQTLGQQSHIRPLIDRIRDLAEEDRLWVTLKTDVADDLAWLRLLQLEDFYVSQVEIGQDHVNVDDAESDEAGRGASARYRVAFTKNHKGPLEGLLRSKCGRISMRELAEHALPDLHGLSWTRKSLSRDGQFDPDGLDFGAITIVDSEGHPQKLYVRSRTQPRFSYALDTEGSRLSERDFLLKIQAKALSLMKLLYKDEIVDFSNIWPELPSEEHTG